MTRSQLTLAGTGFEKHTKVTRRAQFLAEMDRVVPWRDLCARIAPVYPKAGNGRPPVGLKRMLRMYFLQHWFNLSDPAVEEALYDSPSMRAFVGVDLGREPVPDETTVCKFRHPLEEHGLGEALFDAVREHLRAHGVTVSTGTIVDATIIAAPSSTKNATGTRDPGMHQTQKGRQWYFGMKGHFGVDSQSKLIHSVEVTRPTSTTATSCRGCCTARNGGCGAIRRTRDKAGSSVCARPTRATSSIAARGRPGSGRRIDGSPGYARGSSTRSG